MRTVGHGFEISGSSQPLRKAQDLQICFVEITLGSVKTTLKIDDNSVLRDESVFDVDDRLWEIS